MPRRTRATLGREHARLAGLHVHQQQRVTDVRLPALHQHEAPVRRVARGVIGAVLLQKQPRLAVCRGVLRMPDAPLVDIEVAAVAGVAGIGDPRSVRRPPGGAHAVLPPAAELVDDVRLVGQRLKNRAVIAQQIELGALVAAAIAADEELLGDRRIGGAHRPVAAEGELRWPGGRLGAQVHRHGPDLANAGDVGDEADPAAIRREAGPARRAHVEIALEVVGLVSSLVRLSHWCRSSPRARQATPLHLAPEIRPHAAMCISAAGLPTGSGP